ncbi:MAG: PQQ-binding-like beta-propeller repeat protein [Betaproteobacteria bacterium]|nr:PQQ-binding-like beta-propeller repeat protein [Betaproteobacteria bacterium]
MISNLRRVPLKAGKAALAVAGISLIGALPTTAMSKPVQNEDYMQAAQNNSYWVLPARTYSGNRYVKTDQIDRDNVDQLKKVWTFKIPDDDAPVESVPIVWGNTMFVTSAHDHIYALDAKTGELKWEFKDDPHVVAFARNRGVALMGRDVYIGTLDGHLIALDAETGDKVWDKQVVHDPSNSFYTMAPVPYKDMLLLGVSNGDWGGLGYITAFNPKNGDRIWEWKTVPGPGEPGHDTWTGDSWKRGGASVWSGVAIDPKTDTLYMSCGNPQPDFLGTVRKGKNLYSDSVVALDISGSKPQVKWYHQFIPHDTHDWDPAMPPVLFDGKIDGQQKPLVAVGDKGGNFWILDAKDGKLMDHTVVSYQKGHDTEPSANGNYACPNTNGGVEFNGGAYDPNTNTFFVPSSNQCGYWTAKDRAVYIAGQFYLGGAFPKLVGPNTGWFNAIDVNSGVFKWRHHFDTPANGSALVTSTGLVFTGELSGNLDAFDTRNGKLLWQYDTGSPIAAPAAAYKLGGTEYIAVASGPAGFVKSPKMSDQDAGPMISVVAAQGG